MKLITRIVLFFAFILNTQFSNAQTPNPNLKVKDENTLENGAINNQFEYVFKKSGSFTGTNGLPYKAVKFSHLKTLKKNVLDSVNTNYKKIEGFEETVKKQANEIETLKTKLSNTKNTLDQTNTEKNSMALLGMQTTKTSYNGIMWGIVIILLGLLLFFVYKFKNSNSLTKQAKYKLEEVETEFEEHRRVALEREQKVRRQLQDEINKNKTK